MPKERLHFNIVFTQERWTPTLQGYTKDTSKGKFFVNSLFHKQQLRIIVSSTRRWGRQPPYCRFWVWCLVYGVWMRCSFRRGQQAQVCLLDMRQNIRSVREWARKNIGAGVYLKKGKWTAQSHKRKFQVVWEKKSICPLVINTGHSTSIRACVWAQTWHCSFVMAIERQCSVSSLNAHAISTVSKNMMPLPTYLPTYLPTSSMLPKCMHVCALADVIVSWLCMALCRVGHFRYCDCGAVNCTPSIVQSLNYTHTTPHINDRCPMVHGLALSS